MVFGDSIVYWAGQGNFQLQGSGYTEWFGKSGLHLEEACEKLQWELYGRPRPSTLIIHVGTNNIFYTSLSRARKLIEDTLDEIRKMLPHTRLIWSEILPRLYYHGERRPGAGKDFRDKMNDRAQKMCLLDIQGHVIRNTDLFPPFSYDFYRYDGLHLSKIGYIRFRQNLENGLTYFNDCPNAFQFPPPAHY